MIVNIQDYKKRKQMENFQTSVYSFVSTLFDFFIRYCFKPILAAVETIRQNRVVVI